MASTSFSVPGYTLLGLLGQGAYGSVYEARRELDGSSVAIKRVLFDLTPEEVETVMAEVGIMAGIDSPFLTRFYEAIVHPGASGEESSSSATASPSPASPVNDSADDANKRPMRASADAAILPSLCMVEELVDGGTVGQLVQRRAGSGPGGGLPEADVAVIMCDVLDALDYLHNRCHIVHRDVKASNLLVDRTARRIKLCDFGAGGQMKTPDTKRYTIIGTPGWMAPEVMDAAAAGDLANGGHTLSTDIWSVGVTAIELLLGRSPQQDPMFGQILSSLRSGGSAHDRFVSAFSSDCQSFVTSCLAADPNRRPTVVQLKKHPFLAQFISDMDSRNRALQSLIASAPERDRSVARTDAMRTYAELLAANALAMNRLPRIGPANQANAVASGNSTGSNNANPLPDADQVIYRHDQKPTEYAWAIPEGYEDMYTVPPGVASAASLRKGFDGLLLPAVHGTDEVARQVQLQQWLMQRRHAGPTEGVVPVKQPDFDSHKAAMDRLAIALLDCHDTVPDFANRFSSSVAQRLLGTSESVKKTEQIVDRVHKLQADPLQVRFRAEGPREGVDLPQPSPHAHTHRMPITGPFTSQAQEIVSQGLVRSRDLINPVAQLYNEWADQRDRVGFRMASPSRSPW